MGVVIGFFVVCWFFDIVILFCSKLELCVISDGFFRVFDLMIFVNFVINLFVYVFLKKDIKWELSFICCCIVVMNEK